MKLTIITEAKDNEPRLNKILHQMALFDVTVQVRFGWHAAGERTYNVNCSCYLLWRYVVRFISELGTFIQGDWY